MQLCGLQSFVRVVFIEYRYHGLTKIDSSIKDLVLWARSEPLGSAEKLTRSFE